MNYYIEYKEQDDLGWKKFNTEPISLHDAAIDVAKNLMRLTLCTIREVRVVETTTTVCWRGAR